MKNLTATSKGLIMTIITLIAGMITNGGFPSTSAGWTVFAISVVGAVLTYVGKNALLPSISVLGSIDLRDVLSGLILAIGSGVSNWIGNLAAGTPVNWHDFTVFVCSIVGGYFIKNFATKNPPPVS